MINRTKYFSKIRTYYNYNYNYNIGGSKMIFQSEIDRALSLKYVYKKCLKIYIC